MHIKIIYAIILACICFETGYSKSKKEEELDKFEKAAWDLRTDLVHNHTYELANLKKADSLYKKSVEMNSTLGKLYALQIRTYALVGNNRKEEFLKTVNENIKLAIDTKHYDEYFDAASAKVQYLISQEDYTNSLFEAKDMVTIAEKANNLNGMYESNLLMGQIYKYRASWAIAEKHLYKSLNAIRKLGQNDSIPYCLIYRELADCYSGSRHHDKAIEYALKAKQWANYDIYKYFSDWTYLSTLYNAGKMELFKEVYSRTPLRQKNVQAQMPEDYNDGLQVMYYVANGQYEEAKRFQAKRNSDPTTAYDTYAMISYYSGDYKKAYEYLVKQQTVMDSVETCLQMDELSVMEARLGNATLRAETEAAQLKQRQTIAISIGALLLLIFSTMIYLLHRRKKHNKALSQINKEIEQKNTELTKAQATTKEALIKVEKANAMRKHFIENMMHEIRTPLHAISGFTQVLTDPDVNIDKDTASRIRDIIISNTEDLTTMLNQIIHISSIDSGTEKITTTETTLSDIVNSAIEQCKNINNGVELIVKADDAAIITDRRLVIEALSVLLLNAGKFTSEGSITVEAIIKDGNAIISVTDTGIGIDDEKAEKIFERFYKIDEFVPGMGLGLSLCRAIITTLGGTVALDTTYKEQGCCFVITLPKQSKK